MVRDKERIVLYRGPDAWYARTDSERTMELFGTDTLPTAWLPEATPAEVRRDIERLNPGAIVIVIE